MDPITYQHIAKRSDLLQFIRYNPVWYRYLSRDPNLIYEMEKEAKKFHGKTLPKRLEKLTDQAQMLNMLIQFTNAMKD